MANVLPKLRRYLGTALAALAIITFTHNCFGQTSLNYPDLRVIVPTSRMSIVQTASGREFQYTHDTFNGGSGPLEIQPSYNPATGTYQGYQHVYTLDASRRWSLAQSIPVAGVFVFHAEHGHFHFPFVSFGLYAVNATGGIGNPVAVSPKVGFCIGDSFIYDSTLPNAGAFGNWGSCSDPTSIRGLSIGAVDEYDRSDPGQSIPIDGLPDGTYWFRAIADPNNFLAESDKTNNETDVKLTITGNTVQILQTVVPVLSLPPTVNVVSPSNGATLSGMVNLSAGTAVTGGAGMQFLIDGQPLGAPIATPPYNLAWDTTGVVDGTHWLAAQYTNASGVVGTSPVVSVNVSNAGGSPGPTGSLQIDSKVFVDSLGNLTTPVSTFTSGDVVVAFVAADGPTTSAQSVTVSGGGLTWTLVQRSNSQFGTAEIWTANAANPLANGLVTSTLASGGFYQSLSVIAFKGSSGTGANSARNASSGAPQISLTSTQAGSWTFGVGNDWDSAVSRVTPQTLWHQFFAPTGDTFWVQSQTAPVNAAGVAVTLGDSSPTTDRWNFAAVEVLPAAASTPDTTPPTVAITDPAGGSIVSATVALAATATDNRAVASVQFYLDNLPLGSAITTPPFMTSWDTTTASNGSQHTITASATDTSGNTASSAPVSVTVDNSHPPKLIKKDVTVFTDGKGTMSTPSFSTPAAGDLLVAFLSYDGPANSPQTGIVSGAGLTWTLLKRSNAQAGTAEIWAATAPGTLSGAIVTAQPGSNGNSYHGSLTVIAFANAAGAGIVGQASAPTGVPDIYLPGISAGNWVFAAGSDWDRAVARTPVSGQTLVHQRVDTQVGDTFWVQSTTAPSTANGLVDIHDNSPTNDRWNYVAVEIVASRN